MLQIEQKMLQNEQKMLQQCAKPWPWGTLKNVALGPGMAKHPPAAKNQPGLAVLAVPAAVLGAPAVFRKFQRGPDVRTE